MVVVGRSTTVAIIVADGGLLLLTRVRLYCRCPRAGGPGASPARFYPPGGLCALLLVLLLLLPVLRLVVESRCCRSPERPRPGDREYSRVAIARTRCLHPGHFFPASARRQSAQKGPWSHGPIAGLGNHRTVA